ncbi:MULTISPECIES: beta-ketoacyl-[acyl-carrier-protein] synthase family protein [unclassified Micromonospora]|uniref:beta-ketoacyl-[acyl-carrier-protein] synthase family protein n=1 Tax=unclassified Micromonospora TaxID=2617518 RepID=UPI0022C4A170|nr:beta-ketoacyl-[acyl-carrier-protein] synthase family protein [Micromonospora sp. AKA38]GHJ16143.1 3-oxoacyl-ACP synthase [Micromonospora sp. AKA38]
MTRSVVVTGFGLVTPIGNTVGDALSALDRARGVAAVVPELVADNVAVPFAATVADFVAAPGLADRRRKYYSRSAEMAVAAALAAVSHSGLSGDPLLRGAGVAVGVGSGGAPPMEFAVREAAGDPTGTTALLVPLAMPNSPAAALALTLGAHGSATTYAAACASGTTAIGEAFRKVQYGELDVAVAGGTDAPVTPHIMTGMAHLGVMATASDDPGRACRPFDADRSGLVLAEGAAFLVLEEETRARARGATVLGRILGYGTSSDAHHPLAPDASGAGGAQAIESALLDAKLNPAEIGHINGHGTGTRAGDTAEARSYRTVFGDACPPVTTCKGVTGHLFGAAGAMEAIVALECARLGTVFPVGNLRQPDVDIDVVAGSSRRIDPTPVLSHSYGFGGHNSSLVLSPER